MSLAAKLTALLESFSRYQIRGLSRIERKNLSDAAERVVRDCIHVDAADATAPKSGVLKDLKGGRQS